MLTTLVRGICAWVDERRAERRPAPIRGAVYHVEMIEPRMLLSVAVNVQHAFSDGSEGANPVVLGTDSHGNVFAYVGDVATAINIFEIPANGAPVVNLHSFTVPQYGGVIPAVVDSQGDVFGTSYTDAIGHIGSIFEIPAGTTNVLTLHTFDGTATVQGVPNLAPNHLVVDGQGNLYGSMWASYTTNALIFEIPAGTSNFNVIQAFSDDKFQPNSLLADANGNLFGTTAIDIFNGFPTGSVFMIRAGSMTVTRLYTYTAVNGTSSDGPNGDPLILDKNGNVFGASYDTVYEVPAGTSTLNTFQSSPQEPILIGADASGNVYGFSYTTSDFSGPGTLFHISAGNRQLVTGPSLNGAFGDDAVVDTAGDVFIEGGDPGTVVPAGTEVAVPFSAQLPSGTSAGSYRKAFVDSQGDTLLTFTGDNSIYQATVPSPVATLLGFTGQPADSMTGNLPAVSVAVESGSGGIIVQDHSTITLSIASGPAGAVLGGTLSVAAHGGIATFSDLTLSEPGTYTLMASDGILSPGISAPVGMFVPAAQVFVVSSSNGDYGTGWIGRFNTSHPPITRLVSGLAQPTYVALSGSDLFVVDARTNTIGEFTTTGAIVNASLISGLMNPTGIAIVGQDLFVLNDGASANSGSIGEYTLSGATVNAALVSGLNYPTGIAASGSNLFVTSATAGTIGQYTTSGATVNASLFSGLSAPAGIALSGTDLFVTSSPNGTISEYSTSGATVNASLVSGLIAPSGIAVYGSDLFVATDTDGSVGYLGEYTTSGATVNNALVSSLDYPQGVCVTAQPAGLATQLSFGLQPANATAGNTISPAVTVDVKDANGNILTGDNSSVTLSIASGPAGGMLVGTTTVAVQGGIATFNNLSLSQAGTYTLTASEAGLSSAVSSPIDVAALSPPLVNNSLLAPTISGHLPAASLVAGGRIVPITQIVRITNNSAATLSGNVTVNLLLSADPTGNSGGTPAASVPRKIVLRAGKFINVPVILRSLPAGTIGNLYILPQITDPGGNTGFSASAGRISVAAPFVDLQPIALRTPVLVKRGKRGVVIVTLINNGNVAASGNLGIDLQTSTSGGIDINSIDLGTVTRHVVMLPGRRLALALVETFPTSGGPYYVVANVDPSNALNESTLANNLLAGSTTVKLT